MTHARAATLCHIALTSLDSTQLGAVSGGEKRGKTDWRGIRDTAGRILNTAGHDAQNGAALGVVGGALVGAAMAGVGAVTGATAGGVIGGVGGFGFGVGRGIANEEARGTWGKQTPPER